MESIYYLLSYLNPYAYYTLERLKENETVYSDSPNVIKSYYKTPEKRAHIYVITESTLLNQIKLLRKINK